MKYHLVTLGCAKNTVDSMRLEAGLRSARHVPVAEADEADLLLVNTCGFIDAAKDESIEVVRGLDEARRDGQQLYVIGCLTQIAKESVTAAVPGVDMTFGAEQWDAIATHVGPASATFDIPDGGLPLLGQPSAYLKISDGC
ncbi:MAG: 30S ribosomal protein S12 methylthiotransferase RimO, partial [Dehalococcoidia bacterium]